MGWFSSSLNGVWSSAEPAGTTTRVTPDAPWVSAVELEHRFRLQMSWDLFINLAAKDLNYTFSVKEVPLKGEWAICIRRENGEVQFRVLHGDGMPVGFLGSRVVLTGSLRWISNDGQQHHLYHHTYAAAKLPGQLEGKPAIGKIFLVDNSAWTEATRVSGGAFVPATHRLYRLTVTLEKAAEEDASAVPQLVTNREEGSRERAKRLSELNTKQTPHDVCLRFPGDQGAPELWTTSDLLLRSSPYFVDLFSSDFAESEMRTRSHGGEDEIAEQVVVEKDFEDSDDDTDEVLFSIRPHLIKRSPKANDIPFRQITITQTAFSTYHAVLVFLQTGFIDVLPLSSSLLPSGPASRTTFLAKALAKDPSLPSPVSPKSVYRLAHLLQLDDLQTISLNAVRSSLSPSTAAQELFSDTSLAYDDLRAVVVEYCRANWAEVKKSEGWKERTKKAKGREGTAEEKAAVFEVYEAVA